LDLQAKIRGFRVEPEEIETQLLSHENIKEALVVVKTNDPGDKYLCAYVVPRLAPPAAPLNVSQLRDMLSGKLPHYMIPSYFVLLEKMPLTPNGKVDRKALPESNPSRSTIESTYVAPVTNNEKIIARLWKEILHLEEVGIHDNFFALGGNSLNVIQLNRRIKDYFGIDIPVAELFRNLTIRYLGKCLSPDVHDTEVKREKKIKRIEGLDRARAAYRDTIKRFAINQEKNEGGQHE
jgi:acyl carrier protein